MLVQYIHRPDQASRQYLPFPHAHLGVNDGPRAAPNADAVALGEAADAAAPLVALAHAAAFLVRRALGKEDVQLGRGVVLDAKAAAALDVEALEVRALGHPRLRCRVESSVLFRSIYCSATGSLCAAARGARAQEAGSQGRRDAPTTSSSRFNPLAMAWSRASATIDSNRGACFFCDACVCARGMQCERDWPCGGSV